MVKALTAEKKEDPPKAKKPVPQEVIVEALDAVEIEFTIDSESKKTVALEAEQLHTFKASARLAIDISDGGAVNIIHNGKDRGVPGDLGKSIKVNFP